MSCTFHASTTQGINQVPQLPHRANRNAQCRRILRVSRVKERTHWPAGVRRNKANLPEAENNIT